MTKSSWDVIVIGSGMGGMVAGAALSRVGKRVLLLEQYDVLGGLTHSFSRDGFRWDVGLHYLGGFTPGESEQVILDWLTDSPIEMAPMGPVYDTLHIGEAAPLRLSRPAEAKKLDLKERFPGDTKAIDAWFDAMERGHDAAMTVMHARAMPEALGKGWSWWKRDAIDRWCGRTTAEVLSEITNNAELAAVLAAQWGDFGGRPSEASFAMHATVIGCYLAGAFYPVGGASVIAEHLLPTITSAGGEARAGVCVDSFCFDGDRVTGVTTTSGETIHASAVVSTMGARETVEMLNATDPEHLAWTGDVLEMQPNLCHFSLFLGFSGDIEAAGASKSNHWLYPTGEVDALWTEAPKGQPPSMFVSFASLKDPSHDPGPESKHSGELLTWTDWSVVARWADRAPGERGEDYLAFKRQVEDVLLTQFRNYFPALADLVVYHDLSTPLATAAITGHNHGAFYGLEVTPRRMLSNALRMKTPVKGLYLAGQDALTPGIPGAMWGGLLCAGSIDPKVYTHLDF